jgi:hypothetical protein
MPDPCHGCRSGRRGALRRSQGPRVRDAGHLSRVVIVRSSIVRPRLARASALVGGIRSMDVDMDDQHRAQSRHETPKGGMPAESSGGGDAPRQISPIRKRIRER